MKDKIMSFAGKWVELENHYFVNQNKSQISIPCFLSHVGDRGKYDMEVEGELLGKGKEMQREGKRILRRVDTIKAHKCMYENVMK